MSDIFAAILPVFLVAAFAYGLRRLFPLHTKTLSTLNVYLLVPALVFGNISKRALEWDVFGRIAVASVLMLLCMTVVLTILARALRIGPKEHGAFLMTSFPNLGNFGLPVCLFAFGKEGLAMAVVVMVCGSFLQNSVGLYYAQRAHHGMGGAFRQVFRFPMIYAFLLALLFQRTEWGVPLALSRAVDITADAAIPVQLIILGVQLAETRLGTGRDVFSAAAVRLLGGPIFAVLVAAVVGMHGVAAKAFIVQMSGPVAIGMAAYGVQFDVAPRFLASVVSWTSLFSIATVSVVLYALVHIGW